MPLQTPDSTSALQRGQVYVRCERSAFFSASFPRSRGSDACTAALRLSRARIMSAMHARISPSARHFWAARLRANRAALFLAIAFVSRARRQALHCCFPFRALLYRENAATAHLSLHCVCHAALLKSLSFSTLRNARTHGFRCNCRLVAARFAFYPTSRGTLPEAASSSKRSIATGGLRFRAARCVLYTLRWRPLVSIAPQCTRNDPSAAGSRRTLSR